MNDQGYEVLNVVSEWVRFAPDRRWNVPLVRLDGVLCSLFKHTTNQVPDIIAPYDKAMRETSGLDDAIERDDRDAVMGYVLRNIPSHPRPLHLAAQRGRVEIARMLLVAGVNPNATRGWDGATPLHRAAAFGNLAIVQDLLAYGADVNAVDMHGNAPLHYGIFHNLLDSPSAIVRCLLDAGATVDPQNTSGETPLGRITRYSPHRQTISMLLKAGADPNKHMQHGTPYGMAISRRPEMDEDVVIEYLDAGACPDAETDSGDPLVCRAVVEGHVELVRFLIAKGAKLDVATRDTQRTPAHLAIETGRFGMLRDLVAAGALVDGDEGRASLLHVAVKAGKRDVVQFLLASGANPNDPGFYHGLTPVHMAAFREDEEILRDLLEAGGDARARTANGNTPLMKAHFIGNTKNALVIGDYLR